MNQSLRRKTSRFHYGSKVPVVAITPFITILEQNFSHYLPSFFFRKSLTNRSTGHARQEVTSQANMVGVKFWMTEGLSNDTVLALQDIGAKDGVVDSHMKAAK